MPLSISRPNKRLRLLERQIPALAPLQIELLGVGCDNVAFRVNGRLVFRFPPPRVRGRPHRAGGPGAAAARAPTSRCRSLLRRSWARPMRAIPTPSPAIPCFSARPRANSPGLTRSERGTQPCWPASSLHCTPSQSTTRRAAAWGPQGSDIAHQPGEARFGAEGVASRPRAARRRDGRRRTPRAR